jgi:hypothetical protein
LLVEAVRPVADRLDLVDVDRLEQGAPVREAAVQRADADAGAAGDLLQ